MTMDEQLRFASYKGPMTEDEYLAIVLRLQEVMAVEPTPASVIDIARLLVDWREWERQVTQLRTALMGLVEALHVATDDGPVLVGQAEAHAIEVLARAEPR